MMRFRLPKNNRKYLEEETSLQKIFRVLLIVILLGAVVFGFWLNNKRRMEMLRAPTSGPARSGVSPCVRGVAEVAMMFPQDHGV